MIFSFARKHVGLKVALVSTAAMTFTVGIVLMAIAHLRFSLVSQDGFFQLFVLFALACILFQFVLVMLCVMIFVNRPLSRIQQTIQRVSEGNLNSSCRVESEDEFGEIAENFNHMITSLSELSEMRKRMEQRLIKAEESLKYKNALEDKARIIERMNTELAAAFTDLSLMFTVSQSLNSVIEMDELIAVIQRVFVEQYKLDMFALYLLHPESGFLRMTAQKGFVSQDAVEGLSISLGNGVAGRTAEMKVGQYFEDIGRAVEVQPSPHETDLRGAVLSLPLKVNDVLIGVLTVCRYAQGSFSSTDRQSLESIASQIAVAYDRAKLYTKTRELSVRDELTGIHNRRHFLHMLTLELKRAERFKRPVSVLMVDVDHFKDYNDTHGHLKGDQLLKRLTKLIEKNIREVDLLARFGGEEFIIMLPDTGLNEAAKAGGKIRELVKTHFETEVVREGGAETGRLSGLTVSVGVSSYPACAENRDSLINTADMALYIAKKKGRDRVNCYKTDSLPLEDIAEKLRFIH
jgi:diguanylate cyclase (GGDEF)-like protein